MERARQQRLWRSAAVSRFVNVTTDGSGNAAFNTLLSRRDVGWTRSSDGHATVDLGSGNFGSTSDFALNIQAQSQFFNGTNQRRDGRLEPAVRI